MRYTVLHPGYVMPVAALMRSQADTAGSRCLAQARLGAYLVSWAARCGATSVLLRAKDVEDHHPRSCGFTLQIIEPSSVSFEGATAPYLVLATRRHHFAV